MRKTAPTAAGATAVIGDPLRAAKVNTSLPSLATVVMVGRVDVVDGGRGGVGPVPVDPEERREVAHLERLSEVGPLHTVPHLHGMNLEAAGGGLNWLGLHEV